MGKITRCICSDISFKEIKRIAGNRDLTTVEELRNERICCRNCKLCVPYIARMLETGETAFAPGLLRQSDDN